VIHDVLLGYWVTDAPDVLASFLAIALQRYNALEEARAPITAAVNDLERDWHPRPAAFWQQVLAALATARQAGQACMVLFAREHSSFERPVPLGVPVASIRATVSLHRIATEIEGAGILLTVYSARWTTSLVLRSWKDPQVRMRGHRSAKSEERRPGVRGCVSSARKEGRAT